MEIPPGQVVNARVLADDGSHSASRRSSPASGVLPWRSSVKTPCSRWNSAWLPPRLEDALHGFDGRTYVTPDLMLIVYHSNIEHAVRLCDAERPSRFGLCLIEDEML